MAQSSEQMDKLAPKSETGKVLVAIKLSESREDMEPIEKPAPSGPTYVGCTDALKALIERLKKKVGEALLKDKALQEAAKEFVALQVSVGKAILKESSKPAQILEDIGRLEPLFMRAWEPFVLKRQTEAAEAAKAELTLLKQREADAARLNEEAFRAAEKAGVFQVEKDLAAKVAQVQLLEKKLREKDFTGKPADFEERIKKAKREQTALEEQQRKLADKKALHEEARSAHDQQKLALQQARQRADEVARQQATQQKQAHERYAEVAERCESMLRDGDLPGPLATAYTEVKQAIGASSFDKALWLLEDMPALLDAAEKDLREAHPKRDDFLVRLDLLEEPVEQVDEEELASAKDRKALKELLAAVIIAARKRDYVQALKQCDALEQLLAEAEQRIEAARLAQEAFETALAEAQDEIENYKQGEIDPTEVKTMEGLVKQAQTKAASQTQADFGLAHSFVEDTLKPQIKHFLKRQKEWSKVEREPRPPRQPPAPPNYAEAADTVVREVLKRFRTRFDYAGPSFDVSELYPRNRYDPVRLKRAVRDRFNHLLPATELTTFNLNSKHYFNLGAGGTTKKAYEYNVKVKKPGEPRALAQIHIVYLS